MTNTKRMALALMSLLTAGVTAASATGTLAWFSVNRTVTVTGMTVTTKVASALYVADGDHDNEEANFVSTLSQTRSTGILQPVSSVDAQNFFYTVDAAADGKKIQSTAIDPYVAYNESAALDNVATLGKDKYDKTFQLRYDNPDRTIEDDPVIVDDGTIAVADKANAFYGYIDFTMYLKAVVSEDNTEIALTEANLDYAGTDSVEDLSWRIGVLLEEVSAGQEYDPENDTLVTSQILTRTGAENNTDGKAVASTTALGDVAPAYNAAGYISGESDLTVANYLSAGDVKYYYVVVRLWLEGEDQSCNNETYLSLTSDYNLSLQFEAGTSLTPVSSIS